MFHKIPKRISRFLLSQNDRGAKLNIEILIVFFIPIFIIIWAIYVLISSWIRKKKAKKPSFIDWAESELKRLKKKD